MSPALHLVRLSIDTQKLYSFARRSKAASRELDEGYAVHALFAALFDHGAVDDARIAPRPFHIVSSSGRHLEVLGYAGVDHVALLERAGAFADPLAWGVCDLEAMVSKPMPTAFCSGTILGFSVRLCPTSRIARRGPMTKDRAEVDAFLARAWEAGPAVTLDREQVYREWLRGELSKESASRLVEASMQRFCISRLHRRTQGEERVGHRTERPDVTFEGTLEVGEAGAFARRLARGLGRHRAFGFGMLLLKPAGRL